MIVNETMVDEIIHLAIHCRLFVDSIVAVIVKTINANNRVIKTDYIM